MPKMCCVPTCKLRSDDLEGTKTTFHTFPKDKNLKEKWEEQLKTKFVDLSLKKYSYVCSSHFQADCSYFNGLCKNLRLKQDSYPSIYLRLKEKNLEKLCIEADTSFLNDKSNEQVATTSESSNDPLCKCHVESDMDTSRRETGLPADELLSKKSILESKLPETVATKSCMKSLINLDIESLDASDELKHILHNAKTQINSLQRKNRTLRMRLYRWKR